MGKTVEELTKDICALKTKNENTFSLLEKQADALLDKSIEFLKERIKYEIEKHVKNNSVRTKELADQGVLKDMKEAMMQLLDKVETHTKSAMEGGTVFIHRTIKIEKNKSPYEYMGIVEKKYKEAYQNVVGFAGEILKQYEYITVGNDYSGRSEWQYIGGSGGKMKYGYAFDVRNVESDWKKYTDTLMSYYEDMQKYHNLIAEKEEKEAMDLWESV